MKVIEIERFLARTLPGKFLKDFYPRAMRRLGEMGFFKGQVVAKTKFDFVMHLDRVDAVKYYIYYFEQFEPQISLAWERLLKKGDRVIDIGGNVGYYALLAAKLVGDSGRVATFEPSGRIFRQLEKNILENNFLNIIPFNNAVSNKAESVKLYYGGDSEQGNSSFFSNNINAEYEIVECVTFQEIVKNFDLKGVKIIKIDVEGAEPLVLESLLEFVPQLDQDVVIFLEISPANIDRVEIILKPFFDLDFKVKMIRNEYFPLFYNDVARVELSDLRLKSKHIADLLLTRDEACFDRISSPR